MKKIVYKIEDGIAVIIPTGTIKACMKDIPKDAEYRIVEEEELPRDRIFRNAWNYELKEDISKSKEIWKDKLRIERKPLLEELDVKYILALEIKDEAKQINVIAQKQVLRDITKLVDLAETINEIKNVILK